MSFQFLPPHFEKSSQLWEFGKSCQNREVKSVKAFVVIASLHFVSPKNKPVIANLSLNRQSCPKSLKFSPILPPKEIHPFCCWNLNLCNHYILKKFRKVSLSSCRWKLPQFASKIQFCCASICRQNSKLLENYVKSPSFSSCSHCQIVRCSFLCLKILLRT